MNSGSCFRCRTKFNFLIRQYDCHACGKRFCFYCSRNHLPLPDGSKKIRVCDICFHSAQQNSRQVPQNQNDQAQSEQRRLKELQDKEEEELALAIALSQSEAEHKNQSQRHEAPSNYRSQRLSIDDQQLRTNNPSLAPHLEQYVDRNFWETKVNAAANPVENLRYTQSHPTAGPYGFEDQVKALRDIREAAPSPQLYPPVAYDNTNDQAEQRRFKELQDKEEADLALAIALSQNEADRIRDQNQYASYNNASLPVDYSPPQIGTFSAPFRHGQYLDQNIWTKPEVKVNNTGMDQLGNPCYLQPTPMAEHLTGGSYGFDDRIKALRTEPVNFPLPPRYPPAAYDNRNDQVEQRRVKELQDKEEANLAAARAFNQIEAEQKNQNQCQWVSADRMPHSINDQPLPDNTYSVVSHIGQYLDRNFWDKKALTNPMVNPRYIQPLPTKAFQNLYSSDNQIEALPAQNNAKSSMMNYGFSDPTESLCNQFEAVNLSAPQMRRSARSFVPRESEFKEDWPYSSFPSVPLNSFVTPAAIENTSSAFTVKENARAYEDVDIWSSLTLKEDGGNKEVGWDIENDFVFPSLNDSKEDDTIFAPLSFLSGERILTSRLVAEHLVVGSFDTAQHLLCDQLGVIRFEPFKQLFMDVQERNEAIHLEELTQQLQACYRLTTEGKFTEAITRFRQLLLSVPLLVVDSKQKVAEAQQLIEICRKYLVGLLLEQKRRELPSNTEEEKLRVLELAAYFTHCGLQPPHTILTLRTAVKLSYGLKQYRMCYIFAQRCLELGPKPDVAQQMRKVQAACGNAPSDARPINYDNRNSFNVCSRTFVPLYQGKPQIKCPFCGASFDPKFNGQVCDVCQVAEIGRDVTGLCISTFDTEC